MKKTLTLAAMLLATNVHANQERTFDITPSMGYGWGSADVEMESGIYKAESDYDIRSPKLGFALEWHNGFVLELTHQRFKDADNDDTDASKASMVHIGYMHTFTEDFKGYAKLGYGVIDSPDFMDDNGNIGALTFGGRYTISKPLSLYAEYQFMHATYEGNARISNNNANINIDADLDMDMAMFNVGVAYSF